MAFFTNAVHPTSSTRSGAWMEIDMRRCSVSVVMFPAIDDLISFITRKPPSTGALVITITRMADTMR